MVMSAGLNCEPVTLCKLVVNDLEKLFINCCKKVDSISKLMHKVNIASSLAG